ncbi:MAG: hypothetical protein K2M05_02100 [Paramuribaculum sp.]|nr:hypothetical protein [Paramuribaculum sp.]
MNSFNQAYKAWAQLATFRANRLRYKNYTYGRQWEDPAEYQGRIITEGERSLKMGRRPMTNNLIRRMVKSIVGRFRHRLITDADNTRDKTEPSPGMAETARRNMLDELDCRMLEEFLISGCAIQRVVNERRHGGTGVWVDNVDPDRFFCNAYSDPRGFDIELIGQLHDMSLREAVARFAPEGGREAERVASLLTSPCATGAGLRPGFFSGSDDKCRVIEVWTLEADSSLRCHDPEKGELFTLSETSAPRLRDFNLKRRQQSLREVKSRPVTTLTWQCRWYAPDGTLLMSRPSPYPHRSHPFVVKHYPMTAGETHSPVEDVIDQQRYINRIITLIDHIMSASAKGVLLFPVDQKPENLSWEQIAERWANPAGLLPYVPSLTGNAPQQIINNSRPENAYSLLELELKLMDQVSGVNGALDGRTPETATSAALYGDQTENATIALLDVFAAFDSFRSRRDAMIASFG